MEKSKQEPAGIRESSRNFREKIQGKDRDPLQAGSLRDLLCCLPRLDAPPDLDYDNIFRVLIVQFLDAYDVRSVKKSCIHIVHPDGRLIPFDTFNLFYRDQLETKRLIPLRRDREQTAHAG